MSEKFVSKGDIYFYLKGSKIQNYISKLTEEEKLYMNPVEREYDIYDLMNGKEFADDVESRCLINYDGTIAQIFVDGFKSNLGIWDCGIHQGNFCVDLKNFRELCDKYDIKVNWANK